MLNAVEGRADDVLVTRDGRKIGRLSTVFKNLPIVEAQTIQVSFDKVIVKVVLDESLDPAIERQLVSSLRERIGEMQIQIEVVDSIPRGANGKFRAVIREFESGVN